MAHQLPDASTESTDTHAIVARIDARLAALEAAAAEAPHAIAALGDTFDSLVDRLAVRGVDVDARARDLLTLLEKLTAPDTVRSLSLLVDQLDQLGRIAERAQLHGPAGRVLGAAAGALANAAAAPARSVGVFGAIGALGNPDVQRALGLLLDTAQALGSALQAQPADNLLTHEARR